LIDFGADIVVHSVTKFLGGHGTAPWAGLLLLIQAASPGPNTPALPAIQHGTIQPTMAWFAC
jgi:hypothetical protein